MRRSVAWRILRGQVLEVRRVLTIRPMAPPALILRTLRFSARVAIREAAFQFAFFWFLVIAVLLATDAANSPAGVAAAAAAFALALFEVKLAVDSLVSVTAIESALEGLETEPGARVPRAHLVMPLLMLMDRHVAHTRGVRYYDQSRPRLRLDIYRPTGRRLTSGPLPAVIQVHGGGWIFGSRLEQGIPLLNHLAASGWVGFNIDYRLSPQATFPDQIVDVKRAIAWVRENAHELGVDPERICITGGSAGGHLTALAGLTENDPAFQPGFEDADTSVSAAVPFYAIYDLTDADGVYYPQLRSWVLETIVIKRKIADAPEVFREASPRFQVHEDAPPFMVIHGEDDTLVPVSDARAFSRALSETSRNPVRYVELPGAEHAFDLLPSVRTARTVEGIERFLRAVVEPRTGAGLRTPAAAASEPPG